MATQYGKNRIYTSADEKDSPLKQTCPKCHVEAVPRGISDTHATAPGEKHCPNCGHIYGRTDH
jgi:ribosomal protein S27AE